jgi:hypothetical protein
MGLDMYARRISKENAINAFSVVHSDHNEEIHYWRKHHNLHGWMQTLYQSKGGTEEFNSKYVQLTLSDLLSLENDIKSNNLPITTGFFFGNNPPDEESNKDDLEFVDKARKIISEGDCVYYFSWW